MALLVAVLILLLLSIKFLGLRAYLYANFLLFTIAWGIAVVIMLGSGVSGKEFMACLVVEIVGIVLNVLILFLSSIRITSGYKLQYCWYFTVYGLCLFVKFFLLFSIILIPVWYMIFKQPMEKRIAEFGQTVYVDVLGNGEYRDAYGQHYKEKQ